MSENRIMLTNEYRQEEMLAGTSGIYPGMLLEQTSATANTCRAHSVQGECAERMFAVEDALQGKTVDDVYTSGARVSIALVPPGGVVLAMIEGGEVITKGEKLISSGNGKLISVDSIASAAEKSNIIAIAVEACSQTEDTLSAVRVM